MKTPKNDVNKLLNKHKKLRQEIMIVTESDAPIHEKMREVNRLLWAMNTINKKINSILEK